MLEKTAAFIASIAAAASVHAYCSGRVVNPITDVCWECMFPMTVGRTITIKSAELPDAETDASAFCACGSNINIEAGINFSYWEPVRTVEVVRHSGCMPSLGGAQMNLADVSVDHARSSRRGTAFWQAHWYTTPWLFITEVIADFGCYEAAPWDLAYLSELDPTWDDPLASFVLHPDSALFTSGSVLGACAVDCIAATAAVSMDALYWCSGCSGALFPLSGWIASQVSPVQAWHLIAHRFAVKLARQGMLHSAHGKKGQCSYYVQPMLEKDVWRTQLVLPSRGADASAGCHPLGRSTALWSMNRSYPVTGEDGAILLFRKRDCCLRKNIGDAAAGVKPEKKKLLSIERAPARNTAPEQEPSLNQQDHLL